MTRGAIIEQIKSSEGELCLSSFGPRNWDRICVLGPYTSNEAAGKELGFQWDAEGLTGIETRDDIYVLVFTNDDDLEMYLEMPRHEEDLLHSEKSCFAFSDTVLKRDERGNWSTIRN